LVANGKVYVATSSDQLAVYGLVLMVAPRILAFGGETTNLTSAPMSITVTNSGTVALPITSITLTGTNPGQFSQTHTCGASVAVGSTCTISVVFKPMSAGSKSAALRVDAGGGIGTQAVELSGVGVLPAYTVAPASVAFGSETTNVASAPVLITVINAGAVALPITNITLAGTNPGQFSQTHTCGVSVAVGSTCTISVVFKPMSAGSKSAALRVDAGGGANTQTVALTGTGT
jgi:hypothetical protein